MRYILLLDCTQRLVDGILPLPALSQFAVVRCGCPKDIESQQICYSSWGAADDTDSILGDKCTGEHLPVNESSEATQAGRQRVLSRELAGAIDALCDQLPRQTNVQISVIWSINSMLLYPEDHLECAASLCKMQAQWHANIFVLTDESCAYDDSDSYKRLSWVEVLDAHYLSTQLFGKVLMNGVDWIGCLEFGVAGGTMSIDDIALELVECDVDYGDDAQGCMADWLGFPGNQRTDVSRTMEVMHPIKDGSIPLLMLSFSCFELTSSGPDSRHAFDQFKEVAVAAASSGISFLCRLGISVELEHSVPRPVDITDLLACLSHPESKDTHNTGFVYCQLRGSTARGGQLQVRPLRSLDKYCPQSLLSSLPFVTGLRSHVMGAATDLLLPMDSWPEIVAWKEREKLDNVRTSLKRLQSSDMMLGGIPVPSLTSGEGQGRTIDDICNCFRGDGLARSEGSGVSIPVIQDRLLTNMQPQSAVEAMSFSDAQHAVGHGMHYCVESRNALKMDSRLTKIRNRYIINDTACNWDVRACAETSPSEKNASIVPSKTDGRTESVQSTALTCSDAPPREKRSDRHKRRLRVIVDATLTKYGDIDCEHPRFKDCSQRLYILCKSFLKDLQSSKELKQKMKALAKANVSQVVQFETSEMADHGST